MWTKKHVKYNHKNSNGWFGGFCFTVLCFCLLVILWGAWVRISHSGDGCGQSWPSCQGKYLIDSGEQGKTWIEWIHRATSGLFGIAVILLVVLAFLKFPFRHPICKSAFFVLFFTISEALIGARLVLTGLTGGNTSFLRVLTMNLHLLNSVLLTSSLFILWRFLLGKHFSALDSFKKKKYFFSVIFVFFLIAFFGSVSSLSSSFFPSTSLWEGAALDFNSQSHWLVRLRVLHPILALLFGGSFLLYYMLPDTKSHSIQTTKNHFRKSTGPGNLFILCLCLALLSGLMNLLFLSPVFLKLTHLLIVYLLAISFILALEKHPK